MSWIVSGVSRAPTLFQIAGTPSAAYSLRQLDLVDKNVIRVRRSSDNTESNFTATQISDGSLAAFVGAGNDGFIRTWYDQSGNGLDLEQTATGSQPQIVSSGSLITENNKPAILYTASARWLSKSTSYSTSNHSVFQVVKRTSSSGNQRVLTIASEAAVLRANAATSVDFYGAGLVQSAVAGGWPASTQLLFTSIFAHSAGSGFIWRNGSSIFTNTAGTGATATVSLLNIGGVSGGAEGFIGNVQEVVIFRSNETTNRSSVEANINAHYAIY
jgi:hypothetical protein